MPGQRVKAGASTPAGLRLAAQATPVVSQVEARLDELAPSLAENPEFRRSWRGKALLALTASTTAVQQPEPLPVPGRERAPSAAVGDHVFEVVLTALVKALENEPNRAELLIRGAAAAHRTVVEHSDVTHGKDGHCADADWDMPSSERRELSRELHDWVGSGVSLALRQLDLYAIDQARDATSADRRLVEARRTLEELLGCIRRLVSGLREQRWVTSLQTALEEFVARANLLAVATTVAVRGDEAQLPPRVRDELFLVTREALRNAFVHGQAEHIDVVIDITAEHVRARVEDDGVGFDARRVELWGSGIASMQERISLLGGSINVAARRPSGTRVDVVIDLPGKDSTDDGS